MSWSCCWRLRESGPEVEALQEMLKAEGYDLGTAGIDGKFGRTSIEKNQEWTM